MTNASDILARLQRAASQLQAGDAPGALAAIDAILAVAPSDVEALHLRAMALGRAGPTDDAIAAFEQAAAVHPRPDIVLVNFGNFLKRAGEIAQARAAYERATLAAPRSADAFNALGLVCRDLDDLAGARAAFAQAVALSSNHPQALNNLATTEAKANRHADAVELLGRAIAAQPSLVAAYINRGASLRMLGRRAEALVDQQMAARLAPDHAEPHYQLAATLHTDGRSEEAKAAFQTALRIDPTRADIHRDFARMRFEMGEKAAAFEALDAAIATAPTPALLTVRAEISLLAEDGLGAARAAGRAIALDPTFAASHEVMARADRALGDFSTALAAARRGADLAPDNFEILHTCCELELATGDADRAVALLDRDAPRKHLQKHMALKAVAMRRAGDAGYRALYDYDRFTAQIAIDAPPGYASIAAFNDALADAIQKLHRTSERPIDQTLYGGTQSVGRLWNEPDPVIQTYVAAMRAAAAQFVAGLPDDRDHPFLAQKSDRLDCVGAWSVILSSGGGHVDHFHPAGWISACYYVSAPDEIFAGERAGYLRLGGSGIPGIEMPAERYYPPTPGTVVFFPSYIWHGVEPFVAQKARITAPFDLAPISY